MDATAGTKTKDFEIPCLPFDFVIEEEKEKERQEEEYRQSLKRLRRYDRPATDNEKLFNAQFDYYNGKPERLNDIFLMLYRIAPKLVRKEAELRKIKLQQEIIDDYASEAVMLFIIQIKKNRLIIKDSFIAYLRLQVLKAMFSATLSTEFERWCIRNDINFLSLDTYAQQDLKARFEQEEGIERKEKHNGTDTDPEEKSLFEWSDYRTPEMGLQTSL